MEVSMFQLNIEKDIFLPKDETYLLIKKIYHSKVKKKDGLIIKFYKKFETNLTLKISYDKNFKKKSNIETSIASFLYLGILISKVNKLNLTQKTNCILKILDKILIKNQNIKKCETNKLKKLLSIESKYIKMLIDAK